MPTSRLTAYPPGRRSIRTRYPTKRASYPTAFPTRQTDDGNNALPKVLSEPETERVVEEETIDIPDNTNLMDGSNFNEKFTNIPIPFKNQKEPNYETVVYDEVDNVNRSIASVSYPARTHLAANVIIFFCFLVENTYVLI